jgi:Sulfotransferase family
MRAPDSMLLYILGSGHCGSTLLDLLLNGHSQILSLGEIVTLGRYIALAKRTPQQSFQLSYSPSQMGKRKDWMEVESHPLDTPLWMEVRRCYEYASAMPFEQIQLRHPRWSTLLLSWGEADIEKWVRPHEILLSCIHRVSGSRILTDASKFSQRLYLLQRSGRFNIKVIHLIRNGRAVLNSYLRKYGDFRIALRRWAGPTLMASYLHRQFKEANWMEIRYEDLSMAPTDTLKVLCTFLGIKFEAKMLDYQRHPYFGIGGNIMRDRKEQGISLDERWKHELSGKHKLLFTLTAGWLNRLYRY